MEENKTILIAGGGSGGHLFPALAIGDELQLRGYKVKYIGSKYGIEKTILKKLNKEHYLLNIKGFQRTFSIKNTITNLLFPFRFIISYVTIKILIKKINPLAIIGTGGYASGIPLLASLKTNIKTIIHEQNSYPGITTRKLASSVDCVCISSQESNKYIQGNIIHTGIPLRNDIIEIKKNKACEYLGLDKSKKTVLVIGGSQGSERINKYFKKNYQFYIDNNYQLIWQCGVKHYSKYKNLNINKNIKILDFIDKMEYVYSASDIVVSRAGALAVNEIALMKKNMILIPLPSSAANHQYYNAKYFSDRDAAILIEEKELIDGLIEKKILEVFNTDIDLGFNANNLIMKDAKNKIVDKVVNLIEV